MKTYNIKHKPTGTFYNSSYRDDLGDEIYKFASLPYYFSRKTTVDEFFHIMLNNIHNIRIKDFEDAYLENIEFEIIEIKLY